MDIALTITALALFGSFCLVFIGACLNALFRDQPVRPSRDGIACFAREWAAMLVLAPACLIGLRPRPVAPSPPEFPSEERIPVLLVPGFGLNRGSMFMFALYLRRCGWRWVHAINHRPRNTTVPVLARNLAHEVEETCAAAGVEQVDVIGHSMGGIVAAFYVNELGGSVRVRRLVTLGTPWAGTRAWVFGWRREARDLAHSSPVLAAAVPPRVPTTSIWSASDAIVLPPESSVLRGASVVQLAHVGHLEMLFNGRAWRAAGEALAVPASDETAAPPPSAEGAPGDGVADGRIAEPV